MSVAIAVRSWEPFFANNQEGCGKDWRMVYLWVIMPITAGSWLVCGKW